jgi:hypothetical protein
MIKLGKEKLEMRRRFNAKFCGRGAFFIDVNCAFVLFFRTLRVSRPVPLPRKTYRLV